MENQTRYNMSEVRKPICYPMRVRSPEVGVPRQATSQSGLPLVTRNFISMRIRLLSVYSNIRVIDVEDGQRVVNNIFVNLLDPLQAVRRY
jgi:hypothetical protein